MNTRFLAIAIFIVTLLAITPNCSRAQEPDMKQVCHAAGLVTLKLCAKQAVPGIKTEADRGFAKSVCLAAAYKSEAMCLDEKTIEHYSVMGDCEGAALFNHDAIANAGRDVVNNYPEAERKALLIKTENWAGAAGTHMLLFCQDLKSKEAAEAKKSEGAITL